MAITQKVTFQMRRGAYVNKDDDKLVSGEPCAVLSGDPNAPSGKAFYVCFQAGDVRRMVSLEDLEIMVARGDFTGEKGDTGVGIADVEVNAQSHLIITLTDGRKIDAGYILDILEQVNSDEQKRIQAEKERVAAEEGRKTAEADRKSAEIAREGAEDTRISNENTRKYGENTRVSNENARKTAETDRVQAENARVANEHDRIEAWAQLRPAVELATAEADRAADNANDVADDLVARRDAGEFEGEKGDKGDKGDSGIMAPSSGMFSLWVDPETGDLYADYPDGSTPPQFEYDEDTGELYFVTDDGGVQWQGY